MEYKAKEDYKKNIWMYLIGLSIAIIAYAFNFRMTISLGMVVYWGVYFYQHLLLKRLYKIELLLLMGVIILNSILEESYIYTRLDMLLAIYFAILSIYYVSKSALKYRGLKILSIALIMPLALWINAYERKDDLIKDRGLEKCIREELANRYYVFDKELTLSNLEKIRRLNIWENDAVHNLEGIEQLKNLESLEIENTGVQNLQTIGLLKNLKDLRINKGTLDHLQWIINLESLEELELVYVQIDSRNFLDNLHGLRKLSIQGVTLTDLSVIRKLKDLEELRLSYSEINNITGIEYLTNLKRLELYHTQIQNTDKIKESKSLEVIDLSASEVRDMEELKKLQGPIINIR